MPKRPGRIIIITIFGILIGLLNILPVISGGYIFLAIGLITILLSLGIFMLWNWARIAFVIFSILFIAVYALLTIAAFQRAYQGFAGMACFFHLPLLLLSISVVVTLNQKEIKLLYKK